MIEATDKTDYYGNRREEKVIYKAVSFPDYVEGEELSQFTGFKVTRSIFTTLKESGSADFDGSEPDDHDLLRIYYQFKDDNDLVTIRPIATMRMVSEEPSYTGDLISGSVDLSGLLEIASQKHFGMPYTVSSGTNCINKAVELAESLNLKVEYDTSSVKLANDHTFSTQDADCLTVINWLLDTAGFASAYTDELGVVQFRKYVEPIDRTTIWEFCDDEKSIMKPEVPKTISWSDTPNVVRSYYEKDNIAIWASATNNDPTSRASIVQRQAENTLFDEVNELDGETSNELLNNLIAEAKSTLIDNSAEIEYVTVTHPWIPILENESATINYTKANLLWNGSVTNQEFSNDPGLMTTTKFRKYVTPSLQIETDGAILWEVEDEE